MSRYRVARTNDSGSVFTLILETDVYDEAINTAQQQELILVEDYYKVSELEHATDKDWENGIYITVFDTEAEETVLTSDAFIQVDNASQQCDSRKEFVIKTKFIFEGEFTIKAENKAQAREYVEKYCGLVIGGDIHSTLPPDDVSWDFPVHPITRTR